MLAEAPEPVLERDEERGARDGPRQARDAAGGRGVEEARGDRAGTPKRPDGRTVSTAPISTSIRMEAATVPAIAAAGPKARAKRSGSGNPHSVSVSPTSSAPTKAPRIEPRRRRGSSRCR